MLATLNRPLPPLRLFALASALVAAMGVYCLLYNASQGRSETVWNAFTWPVINVLPFCLVFEFGKRTRSWRLRAAMLLAATIGSLGLEAVESAGITLPFEAVRRLPALAVAGVALGLVDRMAIRRAAHSADPERLPLRPAEIDWIAASGNYVVLHGKGRQILYRAPLSALEEGLGKDGFVRIHRSRLVRKAAIRRVRREDVILADGTSLATGARFRPLIESVAG